MCKRPRENTAQHFHVHHGKFNFTAANPNSSRQIQIHHSELTFAAANLNSLRQFQIRKGHFKFSMANSISQECRYELEGECGREWARDSEGRAWTSSFIYQLWNIYINFALSENEFKDFSAWTPLIHFVIQRWWAGIRTRRKIQVFSTPRVKFDCHQILPGVIYIVEYLLKWPGRFSLN